MIDKKPIEMDFINRNIMRHIVSQNNRLNNKVEWLEREVKKLKEFIKFAYYFDKNNHDEEKLNV